MGFMYSSGSETVDRMGQIDFSFGGAVNMIPDTWYKVIRYDSGKTNTNACLILSEIVYWYRPKVEKDKNTGQLLPWQKKFDSDLLQKSYQELADKFGLTKRQVTDAVVFLEHMGLVRREFRNVITQNGLALGNVLFIDLNVDRLIEVTFPEEKECDDKADDTLSRYNGRGVTNVDNSPPITFERERGHVITGEGSRLNGTAPTFKRETYTKNTTKITTENSSSSAKGNTERMCGADPQGEKERRKNEYDIYPEIIAENISLESLMQEARTDSEKERIQMLYDIMCKTVLSRSKTIRINSEDIPSDVVRSVFLKIGYKEICCVCEILDEPKENPIHNLESYIRTLLYNAKTTSSEYWTQRVQYDQYGGGAEKTRKKREKEKKSSFNNFEERDYPKEDFDELVKVLSKV